MGDWHNEKRKKEKNIKKEAPSSNGANILKEREGRSAERQKSDKKRKRRKKKRKERQQRVIRLISHHCVSSLG